MNQKATLKQKKRNRTGDPEKMIAEEEKIPFTSHLEELRSRLIKCFIAIGVGFVAAYGFKETLFNILTRPLVNVMEQGDHLIFTGLPEAFFTYLKVSLLAGLMLASPVVLYQFWMFVAPGLYQKERRLMAPVVILSSFFFIAGALFGYFIVFPWGFKFFLGFATESIRPLPSMKEYLAFSAKLLLAFGLVFELPMVLTFLARLGIVSVDFLKRNRKYAVLLFFAGAAILTPPDVVTQVMMALPLMVMYELSIIGARIFGKKKTVPGAEKDNVEQQAS
jgi:sec-independent protein translocase protein TatC